MTLSEKLTIFQKEKKYSYEEIAKLLEISKSTVYAYIKGTRKPNLENTIRIAKKINCNPCEILNISPLTEEEQNFWNILKKEPIVYQQLLFEGEEEINKIKKRLSRKTT